MNQKHNEIKAWYEDDRFWQTFGPKLFSQQRWDAAPGEIEQVVTLLGIAPPAKILELCCGPGRHSLELARRGFNVSGVDRTEAYIEEARERADAESVRIDFFVDDMRRFCAAMTVGEGICTIWLWLRHTAPKVSVGNWPSNRCYRWRQSGSPSVTYSFSRTTPPARRSGNGWAGADELI